MSFDPLFLIHHVTTFAGGTIGAFTCSDCCSKLVTVYMVASAGLATRHEQGPCNYRPEHVNIMNEKMWYTGDEQVYIYIWVKISPTLGIFMFVYAVQLLLTCKNIKK